MGLREVDCNAGDWIDLAQGRVQWRAYVRTVMNLRVPEKPISVLVSDTQIILNIKKHITKD